MGIADSETCNACSSVDKDYIEGNFYTCDKIKPIWKITETEIKARTIKTVQINEQIALLGYHELKASTEEKRKLNHLLAISKLCISKFRYGARYKIKLI